MTPIEKIRKRLKDDSEVLPFGYIRDVEALLAEIDRLIQEHACMKHQFDELTFFVGGEAGI
jgi:hypothetical protein